MVAVPLGPGDPNRYVDEELRVAPFVLDTLRGIGESTHPPVVHDFIASFSRNGCAVDVAVG